MYCSPCRVTPCVSDNGSPRRVTTAATLQAILFLRITTTCNFSIIGLVRKGFPESLAHAQTVDTRPIFPPPKWPGYEARLSPVKTDDASCFNAAHLRYIEKIFLQCQWKEGRVETPARLPCTGDFDKLTGQGTESILKLLDDNIIHVVMAPANCTDLQPLDISVKSQPRTFYGNNFRNGTQNKLSIMKPLGAQWLIKLYNYLKSKSDIIGMVSKVQELRTVSQVDVSLRILIVCTAVYIYRVSMHNQSV